MNQNNLNIRLDEDVANQMTVNKNLSQEIIVTNTDKLTILLTEHHSIVRKKREWLSPLGIFISVLIALLTAKFDETKFGMSPAFWQSLFVLVCISSFIYTIYLIVIALMHVKKGTVVEFISKLKNVSPTVENPENFIGNTQIAMNIGLKDKEKIFKLIKNNPAFSLLKITSHDNTIKKQHFTLIIINGSDSLYNSFENFLKRNYIEYIDYKKK